jgi:hypothetical protein
VTGRLPPEIENPVPEIESELSVKAAVPLEVTVTDLLTAVPIETFPKAMELALRVRAGVAAFSCIDIFCEDEFEVAVRVAVWAVVTEDTVAVKVAVEAPEATDTLDGTVTAVSLLDRITPWPPVWAAELRETVQLVVPAPVKELFPQDRAERVGVAVGDEVDASPFNLIEVVLATEPCFAVRVTVCVEVTEAMLAEKFTLVAPEGMVVEAGTPIELLLLERSTTKPLLGALLLIITVQLSVPAPVIDPLAQLNPARDGEPPEPLPCSRIEFVVVRVLSIKAATFNSPVSSVVEPGSKRTCATTLLPAARVSGNVPDCTVKALVELLS